MSILGTRLATAQTDGADHKSRFQELAAQLGAGPPRYEVETSGPDHARTFRVVAMLDGVRSEEHTSELQSLMRISYAVFCLKKKNKKKSRAHVKHTSTT